MHTETFPPSSPERLDRPGTTRGHELRVFWWMISFTYLACVYFGYIGFSLWNQVESLREANFDLDNIFTHAHGLRYGLVFPIYTMSDILGWDADWIFSQACAIMVLLIVGQLEDAIRVLADETERSWGRMLTVAVIFVGLSLFMNGRIIPAMLGVSLLINTAAYWEHAKPNWVRAAIFLLAGFVLASVSSGTFIVAIISAYTWLVYRLTRSAGRTHAIKLALLLFGVLALASPLVLNLVEKNINFYGGGIEGLSAMLNHGLGSFFFKLEDVATAGLILGAMSIVIGGLYFLFAISPARLPVYFTVVGLTGGLFGYSTLMIAIPALVVMGFVMLKQLDPETRIAKFPSRKDVV